MKLAIFLITAVFVQLFENRIKIGFRVLLYAYSWFRTECYVMRMCEELNTISSGSGTLKMREKVLSAWIVVSGVK